MNERKGIIYILSAVFLFAIMNAMAKLCDDIPVHELILFRASISFIICFWYLRRHQISILGNNRFWLATRSIMGGIALVLFFFTIKHMPLASASVIQYLSPIFTILVAIKLNKQKVKWIQWLYFALAFTGILLIKGFDTRISGFWLGIGVLSAVFSGIAYNAIIKSKDTDHPMVIVMYVPLVAIPVMSIWCMYEWVTPHHWEWLWLLIMGVCAQAAQYLTTLALHSDAASKITPLNYVGALFAVIFGYFIFHEDVQWLSFIGIALVILALVLNSRVKSARN